MPFHKKDSSEPPHDGIRQEFREFLEDSGRHLRTRGELFGIEAKEAAAVYRRKALLTGAGLGALAVAYLLTLAALIGILGSLFAQSGFSLANWTGATLLLAALHFVAALAALSKARRIGRDATLFKYTREEFRKDQEWLNPEKKN